MTFYDLIRGKNIILVGNSLSALEKDNGELIDSYDLVLRFGKGVPDLYPKQLGTRTDIWSTGAFRQGMRDYWPKEAKVLYNPGRWGGKVEPSLPNYEYIQMYDPATIKGIGASYGDTVGRLSAGAVTAHWLCNTPECEFASITLINFDFFHTAGTYNDNKHGVVNVASSWHIPLLLPQYFSYNDKLGGHPSHTISVEKKLFSELLERDNVHMIGPMPEAFQQIVLKEAAWDETRQPAKDGAKLGDKI